MEHLKLNTESKFNWDDIDVGNLHLDHSQKFFAKKHVKHEINSDHVTSDKDFDKENLETLNGQLAAVDIGANVFDKTHKTEDSADAQYSTPKKDLKQIEITQTISKRVPTLPDNNDITAEKRNPFKKNSKNLMLEWSTKTKLNTKRILKSAATNSNAAPPRAYEFKNIYQHKKDEALRKLQEEERRKREFHSQPVPNFKEYHKHLQNRVVVHQITCPVTPKTIKVWQAQVEKRKQKQENNIDTKESKLPKVKPNPLEYLRKQPHQPKKLQKTAKLEIKPFRLHSEQRAKERREYNAKVQHHIEEKIKQEEAKRIKREQEEIRKIRKLTQFKARPNPFK